MKKIFLFLLLAFWQLPAAASSVNRDIVLAAENYLNSITGLTGNFSQLANGKTERGEFSMLRPGRVRLDYKTLPVQLISNGRDLFFYDRSLDQITTVPLTSTPAGILVRQNINLRTSDIEVSHTSETANEFRVRMNIKNQSGVGNIELVFGKNPTALKSWIVNDATGTRTEVTFQNMRVRTDFPRHFFELQRMRTTGASGDSFYD